MRLAQIKSPHSVPPHHRNAAVSDLELKFFLGCTLNRLTRGDWYSLVELQPRNTSTEKMVYYFTSKVVEPSAFIYVGKDKFESMVTNISSEGLWYWPNNTSPDEDLIKHGLEKDVWYFTPPSLYHWTNLNVGACIYSLGFVALSFARQKDQKSSNTILSSTSTTYPVPTSTFACAKGKHGIISRSPCSRIALNWPKRIP